MTNKTGELGVGLHSSNPEPPMSALGQKRTLVARPHDVRFAPKADINDAMKNPSKLGFIRRIPARINRTQRGTRLYRVARGLR